MNVINILFFCKNKCVPNMRGFIVFLYRSLSMTLYVNIAQGLRLFGLWILILCIFWDFLDENQPPARSVPRQDDTNIVIHVQIEVRTHDPLVPVVEDSTRVTMPGLCGWYSVQSNTGSTYRICFNRVYYADVRKSGTV
jgi:hypothetical protein